MEVDQDRLVDALGSALRYGGSALGDVPELLKRVLVEDVWRDFTTRRGVLAHYDRFVDFVTTPPLAGLGATIELIDRIVGTDDPELLRLLRDAKRGKPGRLKKGEEIPLESNGIAQQGEGSSYTADRLVRNAPDEYEAVRRGEKSINAAARAAGIRPHRISVRLDRPESIAASLRKYMSPEQVAELARLLQEG